MISTTQTTVSDDVIALFEKGLQKISVEDHAAALPIFEQIVALNPNIPNAWEKYSAVLQKLDRYGEAMAANATAIRLYQSGRNALAIDPTKSWTITEWLTKANTLYLHGCYEEAIVVYDAALHLESEKKYTLLNNKGLALQKLGRREDAIAAYEAALKIRPDSCEALNNKGNALYGLGYYQEAITTYDKALAINPHIYEVLNNKGNALYKLRRYQAALTLYNMALALKTDVQETDVQEIIENKGAALYRLGLRGSLAQRSNQRKSR
ncbi:tetratricopeptide repeat protein [Leptothoe kymatousa]|uniref:Tetratricopeptide repeat protein n=1 Tax=Leptothoe kymatousa TAU-MAC 1615 TaxID=2364775 RepID=A0ABS5XYT1_9CYAN|nr:tetratricopeptide repeat protein [Leptothoe kymatousa]MBT9310779.1 tetratricopeptide repeat protein [Leptothoe kymatousa TAU-MAC 1615]